MSAELEPRGRRVLLAALLLAFGLMVVGGRAASAHAVLESTTPTQGSQLTASPASVSLRFGEGVGINERSLIVIDPTGSRVDNGAPTHPGGDASSVLVTLKENLPKASYAAIWHVVSADSHPVSGTFSFGVGVPAGAAPADVGGSKLVGALAGGFRAIAYAGAAMLGGGLFFLLVLWPAGLALRPVRTVVTAGWIASAVAAVALFLLEGPYGAGLGLDTLLQGPLIRTTVGENFGKLLLARLVLLAVALPRLRGAQRSSTTASQRRTLAGLGVLGAATFSLAEHSGQGVQVPVAAPLDILHVLAASIWLGGLLILAVALLTPTHVASLRAIMPRWSRVGIGCVSTLLGTGLYLSWREVGFSVSALTGTTYGEILLVKVGLFAGMLGFAEFGRRWIGAHLAGVPVSAPARELVGATAGPGTPTTASPATAPSPSPASSAGGRKRPSKAAVRQLRVSVGLEAGVGVGVLVTTALLVNGVPARQAYTAPYSATVTGVDAEGDKISVIVDLDPANVGRDAVHLYTFTTAGVVLPFQHATGSLLNRARGIGPVDFGFDDTGTGHGTAEGVVVPSAGSWTLTVEIHTDDLTDYAAVFTVPVR